MEATHAQKKPHIDIVQQFDVYMEKVRRWGQRSSIVKIVPPKEWVEGVQLIDHRAMGNLEIRSPIEQRMVGQNGVFIQQNVERNRNRPLSIHEWFDKCESHADFRTPNPKETATTLDRDSKEAKALMAQRVAQAQAEKAARKEKLLAALKRKEERQREQREREERLANEPVVDASAPMEGVETVASEAQQPHHDDLPGLETSSHTSHSTGEPLATTPEAQSVVDPMATPHTAVADTPQAEPCIDSFYENTDLRQAWLPEGIHPEDFDVAACDRIERKFWKSMGTGKKDSWYGADLPGSLFADSEYPWNVANLPNLLNRLPQKLPGVNSPYLYFGMYRAAFSWHVEDMDLYSINYIHFGAPKFWYAVPQVDADRFESIVRSYFPTEANHCDQFMRHKSCTVSPFKLHAQGIRVNKLVQHQNEFVVTFPRGYHAGFNMGFNCAESVNFALPAWLEVGRKAKACTCVDFSVRIDVDNLIRPPDVAPAPSEVDEEEATGEKQSSKKRKSEGDAQSTPRKRKPKVKEMQEEAEEEEPTPSPQIPKFRIPIIKLPKPPKEPIALTPAVEAKPAITVARPAFPCVLCPSLAVEDLAPVYQPNDFIRSLAKTPGVQAHISCAIAVPEAFTDEVQTDDGPVTYIKGLENIDKARWKLKCQCCVDKRTAGMGTKIQCTKGKCIRAFHVPCARDNEEVLYFAGERLTTNPIPPPPGVGAFDQPTQYEQTSEFVVELLCPLHNPGAVELRKRKAKDTLRQKVHAIPIGALVKVKVGGASYETQLLQVKDETEKVEVRMPDLTQREVAFSALDFRPSEPTLLENEYAGPPKRSRKETAATHARPVVFTSPPATAPVQAPPQAPNPAPQPPPRVLHQAPPPLQGPSYAPQNPSNQYYQPGPPPPTFHLANSVVIVDSQHPQHHAEHRPQHFPQPPPHLPPTRQQQQQHPAPHLAGPHYAYHHQPGPHGPFGPPPTPHGPGPMLVDHMRGVPPGVVYGPRVAIPPARALGYSPPQPVPPPMGFAQNHRRAMSKQVASGVPPVPPLPSGSRQQQQNGGAPQRGWAPPPQQNGGPPQQQQPTIPGGVGKIDLGLDRMMALMSKLPPLTVPAIHLAGTNGKGSVSVLLESCINSAGLRTLRYNSPHLLEPRDAIRVNGLPVLPEVYADAIRTIQETSDVYKLDATTFEIGTAAAYYIANMTRPCIDVMIIECGMGGARDATNVLPPNLVLASGLTSVGLDHTDRLGDTITKIASEKASIAVQNGALVIAPHLHPEALEAARQVAAERTAHLVEAHPSSAMQPPSTVTLAPFRAPAPIVVRTPLAGAHGGFLDTHLALGGAHQLDNLSLALTILDVMRNDGRARGIQPKLSRLTDKVLQHGVAGAKWQGRCSWLEWTDNENGGRRVPLLLDGAHNADSALTLRRYVDTLGVTGPRTFVISLSASPGKSPKSVLMPLLRPGDRLALADFTTPVDGMPWIRVAEKKELRSAGSTLVGRDDTLIHESPGSGPAAVADALRWATKDWDTNGPGLVVVCGSLYLVADVYRLVGRG